MTGHGPDRATFEQASTARLAPVKLEDTLAFMWESRYVLRPTRFALQSEALQSDYEAVWGGFRKRFPGG
jgi:homogentisate 1,2-dioxygenase